MKDQNKPEWLRKAEEEQAKFNETKWAKYTDAQVEQVIGGATAKPRYDSEYQSEQGTKGSAARAKVVRDRQIAEMGYEGYCQWKKENGYDNIKDKKEWHSKGAAATHAKRAISINERNLAIIKELPKEFTKKEVGYIVEKHGKAAYYIANIILRHPEMFEEIGKKPRIGKYGKAEIIYRKLT